MIQKKIASFILIITAFSSCKKIYTCECSTAWTYKTTSGNYNTQTFPGSKTAYTEKLSKKQALSACEHQKADIETNVTNGITANGKYILLTGESIITSCSIKLD